MTQDNDKPEPGADRAADLRSMTSNANWEARLEEARRQREAVLAAKGKPAETPPVAKEPKFLDVDGPAAELIDEAALAGKGGQAPEGPDAPRLSTLVSGTPPAAPKPAAVPTPPPARTAPPLPLGPATPPPAPQEPAPAEVLEFNHPDRPAPAPAPREEPLRLSRSAEVQTPPPTPERPAPPPLSARPETLTPQPRTRRIGPARPEDAVATPDTARLHLIEVARKGQRRRNRRFAFILGAAFGAGLGVAFAVMPPDVRAQLVAVVTDLLQTDV
ncbi:MAG: hypothetical protein AAGA71_05220 [Pseudomonadota bacterium]